MTKNEMMNYADRLNTIEFIPFMIGITWLVISVVGLSLTLGWVVVTLLS